MTIPEAPSPEERHVIAEMLRELADVMDSDLPDGELGEALTRVAGAGFGMVGVSKEWERAKAIAAEALSDDDG